LLLSLISTVNNLGAGSESLSKRGLIEVAAKAKKRDPEAFAILFDTYFEKLRRYIYYKTGDLDAAEDLASETLVEGLESIDRFEDRGGTIGAWLFGIARNVVARKYEDLGKARAQELEEGMAGEEDSIPENVVLSQLNNEELYEALSMLPDEQREVILLRFMEGYSAKKVGRIMSKRPGAVRALQFRATRALGRVLRDTDGGVEDE